MINTADLCDAHGSAVHVAHPMFRSYGGNRACGGQIETVKALEDN